MKHLYLTIVFSITFGVTNFYKAQSEIWGVTSTGGDGLGTIYGLPTGNTSFTTQFNLPGNPGSNPQYTKLLQASNGKLYGMTNLGGATGQGILFEYDTLTNGYARKVDFTGTNGANPKGALMQAANGKLYGMTQLGGTNNLGVIFEYNTTSGNYSVLVNFTGTLSGVGNFPGSQPMGALIQPNPSVTKLYGMTKNGGANDKGVIFEYNYALNTYTTYVDFDGNIGSALGANPQGQLTALSALNTTLYGLATAGGTNNAGSLFQFDYSNGSITKLWDFASTTGNSPQGSLLLSSNGRLYGTTSAGGGTSGGVIFEYVIGTGYNKLTNLTNGAGSTGGSPNGDLMEATNNKLYGLTRFGGTTNAGVIFEYDVSVPATPVYTKKVDLSIANGSQPFGSLMQVSTGKLYGLTSAGGSVNGGVIFNYVAGATSHTKRIDFNLSTGANPNGSLMQASNGKLYGLASAGGTVNNSPGVLFEYDKSLNTYTARVNFSGNTGSNPGSLPLGSLVEAPNGKLYGLTSAGGTSGLGTIFSFDPSTGTHSKLIDFTGNTGLNQGGVPYGAMALFTGTGTANGKFYGMTKQGGSGGPNQGVIFEFDPGINAYSKKQDLTLASVNGYSAFGTMVQSSNKFYGMTQLGGTSGMGVIFEYDPNANTYTKKIDFTGTGGLNPGSFPFGSLVETATVGILYGMTKTGGANDMGVIFEYNATNNSYTKKYDMNGTDGSFPLGSLIRAANNKLYGVTSAGGANASGVLFEYDIALASYTKKVQFSTLTGIFPMYTQLLEICTKPLNPGAISSSTNALCATDVSTKSFSISAISNATAYAWTLPAGAAITSGSNTASIGVNLGGVAAGTYSYGVVGVNICGTGTVLSVDNLTVNALPTVSVNSGAICAGSVFTIVPSGAASYTVQGNSFTVSPPAGNASYTLNGTSAEGCISSNIATSSVTIHTLPNIGVNSGTICEGTQFTIVPTGVITSTVSGGSLIVSPVTSTFYTITGTDGNSCVSANTATAFVTVNPAPVISVGNSTMCAGKNATISPSGAGVGGTYTVNGTPGAGPFVVSPGSTTNYTVAGTNSLNCVSSNTPGLTVTVYTLPVIAVSSETMCASGSATISPSGAGPGGTYTVNGTAGPGPFVVNPGSTTNYTVAGTNSLSCVSSNTPGLTVTVYTLPIIAVNNASMCFGTNATLTPNGAGTGGTYTLNSIPGAGPFVVSPASSTSYTVAGTNSLGCLSSNTATSSITVYTLPVITVNSPTMCFGQNAVISPSGVGAGGTYTLNGTPGAGPFVVSPGSTTNYTIAGTNSLSCVSSNTPGLTVTVYTLPLIAASNETMCAGKNATVAVSGAGVNGTYTLNGTPGAGPFVVSPGSSTSYTVAGTSSLGCLSSNTATSSITVYTLPVIAVNNPTMCFANNVTITPTGAGAGASYTLNGGLYIGPGPFVLTTISSVSYTLAGTNSLGCLSSNTATTSITVYTLPVVAGNSPTMCAGKNATITPTGAGPGGTYTLNGTPGTGPFVVSPGSTTNYTLAGTSVQGCPSNTPNLTVTVYTLPIIAASNETMCVTKNATVTVSGAGVNGTYTLNGTPGAGPFVVSPGITVNYTVAGTSSLGCLSSNTATSTITVYTLPIIAVNSGTLCAGKVFTIVPSGASSYTMTGPVTGTSFTVQPPISASYTVAGTSTAGCVSAAPATANVTVYALPVISATSGAICLGGVFNTTVSGATSYTYASAAGSTVTAPGSTTLSPSSTMAYFVSGTDALGCVSSVVAPMMVTVNPLPVITATNGTICLGNIFTTTVSGAVSYTYSNASNTLASSGSVTLSPPTSTVYNVAGTSSLGCVSGSPASLSITVNPLPPVTISGTNAICIGETTTLTAGGANTYTWSASTGSTLAVNPTTSATYSVIGTDLNACSDTAYISITVQPLPTISVVSGAICPGNCYTLNPGGASTYTYSGGSSIVCPSVTTNYSVSGTSTAGCVSATDAVATVSVVNILTVTISGNATICNGGTVNLTANGASTYSWSTGDLTNTISTTPSSNISYTVIGMSGSCSDTTDILVTVNQLPNVSAVPQRSLICENESVQIQANGTATTYTWSTMATGTIITVSPTTNTVYTLTGTDGNNCVNSGTVSIQVSPCTGVNSYSGSLWEYGIYPNPNAGAFVVETSEKASITVVNALGQTVLKQDMQEGKNPVDLNEQAKGIYFVHLKNGSSTKIVKIIKQ